MTSSTIADEVAKRLDHAQNRVQESEEEIKSLRTEAEQLRKELFEKNLSDSQGERDLKSIPVFDRKAYEFAENLRNEIREKNRQIKEAKRELSALQYQISQFQAEQSEHADKTNSEIALWESKIHVEEEKSLILDKKSEALRMELERIKRESRIQLKQAYDTLDAQNHRIKELQVTYSNLRKNVETLDGESEKQSMRKVDVQTLLAAVTAAEEETRQEVEALEHEIRQLRDDRESHRVTEKTITTKQEAIRKRFETAALERDAIENDISSTKQSIKDLASKIKEAEKIRKKNQAKLQQVIDSEASVKRRADAIRSTNENGVPFQIEISAQQEAIEELTRTLETRNRELEENKNKNTLLESTAQTIHEKALHFERILHEHREAIVALTSEVSELDSLEKQVEELELEIVRLRDARKDSMYRIDLLKQSFHKKQYQVHELQQLCKYFQDKLT